MATAIQSIFIRGHEERTQPKTHIVYRIDIQAHVRSWQMWRRYSEFDDLHTELCKSTGSNPPEGLPPKHPIKSVFGVGRKDEKVLEERRAGLEKYLRAILSATDERWRETYAFKDFLGVPSGRHAGAGAASSSLATHSDTGATQFTSSTWLDEHTELQSRLRDVWADVHKRDALSNQGDVVNAHKANVGAKAKLAGVLSRIGHLGKALQELGMAGMSEGELQRRTDMVARLQDDCEKLGKVVSVARQAASRAAAGSGGVSIGKTFASDADRDALLGGAATKPARRVFGEKPKETEATRPLDNVGLLSLQQQQMDQQDNQLAQLTTILQRQRHLGEAINAEVAQQIEMLDDLSNAVDVTGGKLQSAKVKLNKLS
ncbi:Phox homologous domain-containing protein [Crepidotus variabilis]|uniref:Phox homologous domain-containing protein n=1 Tax=Crepidotus variabilis TaxID=179855 RepID=A0A9P6ENT1_9AGAR|nr:Phox homologous domain-containing protein [Crepidotus variabilis]